MKRQFVYDEHELDAILELIEETIHTVHSDRYVEIGSTKIQEISTMLDRIKWKLMEEDDDVG